MSHIKEERDNINKNLKNSIIVLCILFIFCFSFFLTSMVSALTIGEEKKLAKEYMRKIDNSGLIIKDPIISGLVTGIGNEIVSTLPPQAFQYSFYAFDVDNFNAFATPGANIFVNRGLITALDNIDELAGIIAHETAHASCRHVSQLIDKSKIVNILTLAGAISGVLIGSKGDSELGQGLTMGSLAAGQSAMLTYTRAHEIEADQKGFDYLTKTSFSPKGLLDGLQKIRAADFYGTDNIPDYLKTHPGTTKRIKALELMLARYISNPASSTDNNYNFDMIKYRIIGLYQPSSEADKIFKRLLQKDPDNPSYHYGYALALTKQLKFDQAEDHLKKALSIKFFDPLILLAIGNIYLNNDESLKAVNIFNSIKDDSLVHTSVAYSLGQAYVELENFNDAKTNLEKVINLPYVPFPKAYYYIAKIYSKESNPGLMHYNLGHYYFYIKNKQNAQVHLAKAIKTLVNKDQIERANILLKELKENK